MLALVTPGELNLRGFGFGVVSGVATVVGLNLFYAALAQGVVGVVASVTALMTASIPAIWSIILKGEHVGSMFILGAAIAAAAIVLLAIPAHAFSHKKSIGKDEKIDTVKEEGPSMSARVWVQTVCGGLALGVSLIALSQTGKSSGCWPLVGVGISAVVLSVLFAQLKTGGVLIERSYYKEVLFMMVCMGAAYWAQLYAARSGALAVASIVGALYPVPTILLARIFDKEKLSTNQFIGALCALFAIILIALSK